MNDRGVVLLEVLLAVAILSVVGVSSIAFVGASVDVHARLRAREAELVAAERVLIATSLLSRTELDQRIGMREAGDFVVWIDRPEASLFRVGVAPLAQPAAEILATLVYRPWRTAER
jgi:hypothetical protein